MGGSASLRLSLPTGPLIEWGRPAGPSGNAPRKMSSCWMRALLGRDHPGQNGPQKQVREKCDQVGYPEASEELGSRKCPIIALGFWELGEL